MEAIDSLSKKIANTCVNVHFGILVKDYSPIQRKQYLIHKYKLTDPYDPWKTIWLGYKT